MKQEQITGLSHGKISVDRNISYRTITRHNDEDGNDDDDDDDDDDDNNNNQHYTLLVTKFYFSL